MIDGVADLLSGGAETRAIGDDLASLKCAVETRLEVLSAPAPETPPRLCEAIRHALLGPGKRIRPLLAYLVAEPPTRRDAEIALDVACAVELVHTASLVLDDLPCMDDAMMRRGRLTTHAAFGEATAILTSVALLSRAFGVVAGLDALQPRTRTRLTLVLSRTVGSEGLVSGQEMDVNHAVTDEDDAARANWLKTGVLFAAAAEMGAIIRGLDEERTEAVKAFGRHLGLAFQAHDDLLDRVAKPAETGKDDRQDDGKLTLLSLLGTTGTRTVRGRDLLLAQQALARSGVSAAPLLAMVQRAFMHPRVHA